MINVLIIEDETLASNNLNKILSEINEDIQVLARLQSVEQSIHWLQRNDAPDLIFLDIHLSDDLSFKIFDVVDVSCPIVFTTAYDQYAIKAFELNSIDYILKPITPKNIENSISKYHSRTPQLKKDYTQLLRDLKSCSTTEYKERFIINKADELIIVPVSDISYFYKNDVTYVVLKNGQKYIINNTLDHLEETLNPTDFYRINRQFVVCIDSISKITMWFKGKMKLQLTPKYEENIFVSRDKSTNFKAWMDK
ncbi:MAG: LytTR family DNA-binding domain-containing protein [Crocinitomicaceae bacterium]|nr:LytTR family DNA-binding domain-containing protein [Crocinitomicaceae bacterium]